MEAAPDESQSCVLCSLYGSNPRIRMKMSSPFFVTSGDERSIRLLDLPERLPFFCRRPRPMVLSFGPPTTVGTCTSFQLDAPTLFGDQAGWRPTIIGIM